MKFRALLSSAWRRYGGLPTWGKALVAFLAVMVAVAPFAPDEDKASEVQAGGPVAQEDTTTTTTTVEPTTTTTTTTAPTTMTAAPTTTTTAAPVSAAKPTTTTTKRVVATTTTTAKAATSSSGCHSSYTRTCIPPNVSDADCAGGSGNGPHYVYEDNIGVVGPDVFDLDRDGDGVGCES